MARSLLRTADGGVYLFPRPRRLEAFGAAELIADRLEFPTEVIRRRDPETGAWGWALVLKPPRRDVFENESAQALEICRMTLPGR